MTDATLPAAPPGAAPPAAAPHPRRRVVPRPLPAPAGRRGLGSAASGALEDVPHYVPVGHALRAWRQRAGLTQKRLSEMTYEVVADDTRRAYREHRAPQWQKGLSPFGINRFENGVHSPLPQNAALLVAALNLALARTGVPDRVTADTLRAGTTDNLLTFLLAQREAFTDGPQRFWPSLGISNERARALQAGADWTADEFGAVGLAYPTAADAVRDALLDQARRKKGMGSLRAFARRDRGHPDYAPAAAPAAPRRRRAAAD